MFANYLIIHNFNKDRRNIFALQAFQRLFYLFDTPKYLIAYNLLGLDSAPCKYLEYYMITSHLK